MNNPEGPSNKLNFTFFLQLYYLYLARAIKKEQKLEKSCINTPHTWLISSDVIYWAFWYLINNLFVVPNKSPVLGC